MSGRDIGPDEDRPGQTRCPQHHLARSLIGSPVSSPTDDLVEEGGNEHHQSHPGQGSFNGRLHQQDLEEDTADPTNPRLRLGFQGRRGLRLHEPVDANPASEAAVYDSVFPSRQRVPRTADYYKSEENRLQTYNDWPHSAPVRKEDLAKNGFVYTGSNDKVRCVYCNAVLRRWEHGDDVEEEHRRNSPSCPFMRGDDVGNIPLQSSVSGHPSHRAVMSGYGGSNRQREEPSAGFDIGPDEDRCGSQASAPPEPLLVNGCVRSGAASRAPTGDNVRDQSSVCTEHRTTYSSRPRNQAMAAEPDRLETFEFWPAQIRQRPEQLAQAGLYYIGDSDKVKCFYCDGLLYNWEPDDDPFVEHARWFPQCQYIRLIKGDGFVSDVQSGRVHEESVLQTPAVLAVLAEGHSMDTVQQAINTLRQKEGVNVIITAPKLLEVVMDMETQPMEVGSLHVADSVSSSADVEQLQRENESLRDKQLCKVCMERDVEVIFYPCKHFVCCAMCGTAVTTCPICRQPIESLDKVFMA